MLTDIEIIEGYDNNKIQGITICKDYFFMPVRISGLGKTIRVDEDSSRQTIIKAFKDANIEVDQNLSLDNLIDAYKKAYPNKETKGLIKYKVIDRQLQHFANPKALQAMQGLPILKKHPQNSNGPTLLTYSNFKNNPIIGTIVKAYLANKAIWGLAKIFDIKLIDEFQELQSTSPAVESIEVENQGDLIELPGTFNHLAFVEKGHWDQVDDNPYNNDIINFNSLDKGELKMVEEAKADEATTEEVKTDEAVGQGTAEKVKKVAEDVKDIKEAEKEEAKSYDKMAEEHKKLDEEEDVKNIDEVSGEELKAEAKSGDEVSSGDRVVVDEEETKHDEEEAPKLDEEEEPKLDEKDEEVVDSEMESIEDEERANLVDSMRDAIDSAHPHLRIKMPYIGKRLKPSVVISKFLDCNSRFVPYKYSSLDKNSNYSLLVDAYNDTLDNIEKETNSLYKETGKDKRNFWAPGRKPNESFDKNF